MKLYLLIFLLLTATGKGIAQRYFLNVEKSTVLWQGRAARGAYSVEGSLRPENGFIELKPGCVIARAEISINMKSLKTDIPRLENHLKSSDFFAVAQYPAASFQLVPARDGQDSPRKISGWLSIKGEKNYEEVEISTSLIKEELTLRATLTLDRSRYNIFNQSDYFLNSLKEKAIHNEFTVELNLVFESE